MVGLCDDGPRSKTRKEQRSRNKGGARLTGKQRRSSDGYLSATGMFKAAFPWASKEEELKERTYHKKLSSSGPDEVAGNVWVSPEEGR